MLFVGERHRSRLLKSHVIPLLEISPRGERYPREEIEEVFRHLAEGLKKRKVAIKPLLPLLDRHHPVGGGKETGVLKGFIGQAPGSPAPGGLRPAALPEGEAGGRVVRICRTVRFTRTQYFSQGKEASGDAEA